MRQKLLTSATVCLEWLRLLQAQDEEADGLVSEDEEAKYEEKGEEEYDSDKDKEGEEQLARGGRTSFEVEAEAHQGPRRRRSISRAVLSRGAVAERAGKRLAQLRDVGLQGCVARGDGGVDFGVEGDG
jgi:hypothetical protein